jgi:lysophospholipase L1-like esterase
MRASVLKTLALVVAAALLCAVDARSVYPRPGLVRKKDARGDRRRPIVYLAVGDSTGVGVGAERGGYVARLFARVERARPGSRLVNLCASAAATADVLKQMGDDVPAGRATLVTVGVGANDLIRGVTAEQFARNYEEIVVRLKERTSAAVLLMNIPDLSLAPAVPAYMRESARRHVNAFNERIDDVARRHGLSVIDLYGRSREFAARQEFFSRDGIHPSDAGYEFWARLVWPDVERAINARRRGPRPKRIKRA